MNVPKEAAQWAYDAYGDSRHWRAYNGESIPQWDQLPEGLQQAWRTAADAVLSWSTHAAANPPDRTVA